LLVANGLQRGNNMRKIIESNYVSLDGFFAGPNENKIGLSGMKKRRNISRNRPFDRVPAPYYYTGSFYVAPP